MWVCSGHGSGERDSLNSEAYVKHLVTGRTDEKPLGDVALPLKHGVKTVLISTCWTDFEFLFQLNILNFVIHAMSPLFSIDYFDYAVSLKIPWIWTDCKKRQVFFIHV